jgi:tetratricopeptide (TPR) repeat protein
LKKISIIFGCILFCTLWTSRLFAQEVNLADHYFQNGEYEKAEAIYEKLFRENENSETYLNKLLDCYLTLERFDKAKQMLLKQIKKRPKDLPLLVTYGNVLEKAGNEKEGLASYQKAIDLLPDESNTVLSLGNAFRNLSKYDEALKVYEKAATFSRKYKQMFAYQLAEIYLQKGDKSKMIDSYLEFLSVDPVGQTDFLKVVFQRYLSVDDCDMLETQLYNRIQEEPEKTGFIEMLTWTFIQRKDYKNAFRQSKALDIKLEENGRRVYSLALIAYNERDYDAAISCYDYLLAKGKLSQFYLDAKRGIMTCKKEKITKGYAYTAADLQQLEKEYEGFIADNDNLVLSSDLTMDLADLETYFLNDLPKATVLLKNLVEAPGMNNVTLAKAKLKLGDLYLMQGERWESTLLYSQVDKDFKDDTLGHEARYRNARLSYFMADFEWAKSQFGVLKASTSKLISNDAIDLNVFIVDNTGLDTTEAAMTIYAEAELLVYQNKFDEAFVKLDSLIAKFPKHSLEDDVLWLKAQIYIKKRAYVSALPFLQKIIDDHKEEIRADNALFTLAGLYANEGQLNDKEKAKQLYEKLFTEFSNSTFAIDARKYFRTLRGDKVQ